MLRSVALVIALAGAACEGKAALYRQLEPAPGRAALAESDGPRPAGAGPCEIAAPAAVDTARAGTADSNAGCGPTPARHRGDR